MTNWCSYNNNGDVTWMFFFARARVRLCISTGCCCCYALNFLRSLIHGYFVRDLTPISFEAAAAA